MELIPPDLHGTVLCLLTITWMDNDLEAGERVIAPFREKVAPSVELVQPFSRSTRSRRTAGTPTPTPAISPRRPTS